MFNITKFFGNGVNGTLLAKDNCAVSHNGPWKQLYPGTLLDRWHIGDFASAEYTISVDLNNANRELIKCIVVAGVETANIVVFARTNLSNNLIRIDAKVNNSYVDIIIDPVDVLSGQEVTFSSSGAKVIYTVQYFNAQNSLSR